MKKLILLLTVLVILISCKNDNKQDLNNHKTENVNQKTKNINDTVYVYHENGNVKEKGRVTISKLKTGWWSSFDLNGNLTKKMEFIVVGDSTHLNQKVYFNKKKFIDSSKSSFVTLKIPDTIFLGKNLAELYYVSEYHNPYRRSLSVVIENRYSEKSVKEDIFGDDNDGFKQKFGIFAHREGAKIVKGYVKEIIVFLNESDNDSVQAEMIEHKTFFEREVYVKDTIQN